MTDEEAYAECVLSGMEFQSVPWKDGVVIFDRPDGDVVALSSPIEGLFRMEDERYAADRETIERAWRHAVTIRGYLPRAGW